MNGTLTDVCGLSVGHWSDCEVATGCTVVLCDGEGAVAGGWPAASPWRLWSP